MGTCLKREIGIDNDPEGYELDHKKLRDDIVIKI